MSESNGEKPPQIQDFIFYRELSEIYLLLDHISGRWDKSFYSDDHDDPSCENGPTWLRKVCEIGWPPQTGSTLDQARQAAVLICAKDKLNAAARPANGATIAFTLMVIGEDTPAEERWTARWLPEAPPALASVADDQGPPPAPGAAGSALPAAPPPNRIALAHIAFPGLIKQAASFTVRMRRILWALAAWLVFTCLLSWDVAAGNVILSHLDAVHAQRKEIEQKIADLETKVAAPPAQAGARPGATGEPAAGTAAARQVERLCKAVSQDPGKKRETYHDIDQLHLCDARATNDVAHDASSRDLGSWLGLWRAAYKGVNVRAWPLWQWFGAKAPASKEAGKAAPQNDEDADQIAALADNRKESRIEETARIVALVLGGSVLPLCYGILGAGAAIVRDLWAKMRESLLSPRDYTLALGQLALGATIGACIGLFIAPSGSGTTQAEGALVANWGLSASALSFVAGFGVESVFVALESLVRRIFNTPDPAKRTQ